MTPSVTVDRLLKQLREAVSELGPLGGGLAFDGDGTLWSGDVGDDVFFHALEQGLLRDEAQPALAELAQAHGLEASGTAAALARRIYDAHLAGTVSQPVTYAMMAWCFAGYSAEEVSAISHEALAAAGLRHRLREELCPILEWARGAGLRTVVISASPHPAVRVGAALWGFASSDIAAVVAGTNGVGRIVPLLDGEVPYGLHKARLGRTLLGGGTVAGRVWRQRFRFRHASRRGTWSGGPAEAGSAREVSGVGRGCRAGGVGEHAGKVS